MSQPFGIIISSGFRRLLLQYLLIKNNFRVLLVSFRGEGCKRDGDFGKEGRGKKEESSCRLALQLGRGIVVTISHKRFKNEMKLFK